VAVLHEGRLLGQGEPAEILGDAPLLRTARLRMPGALEMARTLRDTGVLQSDARDLPRDLPGLCRALADARGPALGRLGSGEVHAHLHRHDAQTHGHAQGLDAHHGHGHSGPG
jgi:hypothetical protein